MKTKSAILILVLLLFTGISVKCQDSLDKIPPEPDLPEITQENLKGLYVPEDKKVVLDVYTVKKGDWLIKIARRKYGDPNLWKLIYDYNKYINNPHWIFPGDNLIVPSIVDKLPDIPEKKEVAEEPKKEVKEHGDFIAPPDFSLDATIAGFKTPKAMHSQGDYLFIDIGREEGVKKGKRLYIYRRGRTVVHPYTGQVIGDVFDRIGIIQVIEGIKDHHSTARIIYSDIPVKKGDMLLSIN
ncbi:MAG: LysM peptidoglycan-binding domain-containing protein [Elusimicrobiota bacterium]